MADVDQPLIVRVPLAVEVLVPGLEFVEGILEELPGSSTLVDGQHGGRVDGWHHHARGFHAPGGVRALLGVPEAGPGEVVAEARVEDDLGQKTVGPLGLEEVPQLLFSASAVVVGVSEGHEGRVPGPLMRVESRARLRVLAGPVEGQDRLGLLDQCIVFPRQGHCGDPVRPLTAMDTTLRTTAAIPRIWPARLPPGPRSANRSSSPDRRGRYQETLWRCRLSRRGR